MEKQIIEMLTQMQKEQQEFRHEVMERFYSVDSRLDRIEGLLKGAGYLFKGLTGNRLQDLTEIDKRLRCIESDIYRMLNEKAIR